MYTYSFEFRAHGRGVILNQRKLAIIQAAEISEVETQLANLRKAHAVEAQALADGGGLIHTDHVSERLHISAQRWSVLKNDDRFERFRGPWWSLRDVDTYGESRKQRGGASASRAAAAARRANLKARAERKKMRETETTPDLF